MHTEDLNIVERALDEIEPAADQKSTCRAEIEIDCQHLDLLYRYFNDLEHRPSPGQLKDRLLNLIKLVGELIDLIRSSPADVHMLLFHPGIRLRLPDLVIWHEWLNKVIEDNYLNVGNRGRSLPPLKLLAADYALDLLRRFSAHAPTITLDGPFLVLAQTLYESATSEEGANMRRACEYVLNSLEEDERAQSISKIGNDVA